MQGAFPDGQYCMIPFAAKISENDRYRYTIDAVSGVFYGIFIGMMNPFIPILMKRLSATPLEMGLVLSAPYFSLVFGFLLLRFMTGWKALDIVTIPTIFTRLALIWVGFTDNTTTILLLYVVCQFVEGLGLGAYTRVLKELYSDGSRSMAMGYVRFYIALTTIIGSAVGGWMLDSGYKEQMFLIAGICGMLSSAVFNRVLPRDASPAFSTGRFNLRAVTSTLKASEGFYWMNVTIMLFGFGNLLMLGVLPTKLVTGWHVSNSAVGYLTGLTNIVQMFAYVIIGRFIAKHGSQRGLLLGMFGGLLNPWLFLFAPTAAYLMVPYAFTGVLNVGFDLSWMQLIIAYAPISELAIYGTVYTFLMGIRGIAAMLFSNLVLTALGVDTLLAIAGLFMLAGTVIALWKRDAWKA